MDDFEKWLEGHGRQKWLSRSIRPRTNHNEDCLRAAYEAGQASRERGECGCHLCRTAIGDGYGHDDSEQGTMVKALSARLAATTPVIEAAERTVNAQPTICRACSRNDHVCTRHHLTDDQKCDCPCTGAFARRLQRNLREALATYRAAVTKDDQKPSQEEVPAHD